MTAVQPTPVITEPYPARPMKKGNFLVKATHTTDPKTIGVLYMTTSFAFFMRFSGAVLVDDPWGYDNSLEWAASCPPPRHNFHAIPRIRSERPAFELHYPHMVDRIRKEAHVHTGLNPHEGKAPYEKASGATEKV